MKPIRIERAASERGPLSDDEIALIKGMLKRGDRQSDIAAFFATNSGRVAEINTGERGADIESVERNLPPPGPYLSPLATYQVKLTLERARWALEQSQLAIEQAFKMIEGRE